jgi:simple sugar transport system ATP-binding protein
VQANRGVNLTVAAASIHGVVGENGAGKSTLMNLLYGVHRPDRGEIRLDGRPVRMDTPQAAIAAGIGMVHQHFMLVENFTALENVMLGAEGSGRLAAGEAKARAALKRLAEQYGLDVPLDQPVGELTVGVQQRIEILKALHRGARILILDEPTAVLTPQETEALFRMLRTLRDEGGKSVVLVTHKLREIMAVTDRVTIMRQGTVVAEVATKDTSTRDLAEKMVGRPVLLRLEKAAARPGRPLLEVSRLEVRDARGVRRLNDVSFVVRGGEIVGIAGVSGNGQSELLEAIAGIVTPVRGTIAISGVPTDTSGGPGDRRRRGLAHVPEDRLRRGVVRAFSAAENSILGYHDRAGYRRAGFLDRRAVDAECLTRMKAHDVRPPLPGLPIGAFSGGNQQKLVMAREIEAGPEVLLVGQPTRGVDIGAIEAIHRRLIALRDAGKALLVVSVELEEILALSDRILVMHAGEIVGELTPSDATEEKLGLMMAGVRPEA